MGLIPRRLVLRWPTMVFGGRPARRGLRGLLQTLRATLFTRGFCWHNQCVEPPRSCSRFFRGTRSGYKQPLIGSNSFECAKNSTFPGKINDLW